MLAQWFEVHNCLSLLLWKGSTLQQLSVTGDNHRPCDQNGKRNGNLHEEHPQSAQTTCLQAPFSKGDSASQPSHSENYTYNIQPWEETYLSPSQQQILNIVSSVIPHIPLSIICVLQVISIQIMFNITSDLVGTVPKTKYSDLRV